MIRLVAADMDGTLLDNESKVTENTARTIREFQKQGGIFLVNTGRDYEFASAPLKAAGITCGYICSNGAVIYEPDGTLIQKHVMEKADLLQIKALCKEQKVHINYVTDRGILTDGSREEMIAIFRQELEEMLGEITEESRRGEVRKRLLSLADLITYEQNIEQLLEEGVSFYKLSMNSLYLENLQEVKLELKTWPQLAVASSFKTNIEVTSEAVDKGKTLMAYLQTLGITMEEVMVIGDSENDLSMLSLPFGCTVAMENGWDSLKEICKKTTLSNREDGAAYAIEQWALRNKE